MCGIFGIAGHNTRIPAEVLALATKSLEHRGPDDGGTVIVRDGAEGDVEIGLGNRRLAILDLSPLGHQPMHDPVTGNWIVHNGEIYNFREVRAKLETQGLRFASHSDTEVILKSYAHWGEECLREFRGMFAFAIWDAQQHRLFLARDPMGIKPLYYYQSDRYFIFSSEVRTLLGTGLVPRRIDPAGLISYLTFGSLYDPHTLVLGVNALPAGCFMTWHAGQVQQAQYWSLADTGLVEASLRARQADEETRSALEAEVAAMLEESVRMQMVSDVPVGVFLSGGIDSSSLVGILRRSGVRPRTFSIVFREADYSEAEYSRLIAQQFRTDHHEVRVSQPDFLAAIVPALGAMDLPTIDGINTYFVAERTRAAGVKVALSGLGGDEVFAGYSSFRIVPRLERFARNWQRIPGLLQGPLAALAEKLFSSSDQNRKLYALTRNGGGVLHPYFLSRMLFTGEQQNELLNGMSENAAAYSPFEKTLIEDLACALRLDPVNRVSYLEARCYMLNTLLRDSDCMSMAHGLEVRVPLIDHVLAKKVLALPSSWKLNSGTPKPLLVHALRGELPERIVHRPKRGFTLPFEHWLRDSLRPSIEAAFANVENGPLAETLNASAVHQVWNDFLQGETSWSRPWALYVLQRWCERHSLAGSDARTVAA